MSMKVASVWIYAEKADVSEMSFDFWKTWLNLVYITKSHHLDIYTNLKKNSFLICQMKMISNSTDFVIIKLSNIPEYIVYISNINLIK